MSEAGLIVLVCLLIFHSIAKKINPGNVRFNLSKQNGLTLEVRANEKEEGSSTPESKTKEKEEEVANAIGVSPRKINFLHIPFSNGLIIES
jgi:hypothetical protein